MTVGEVGGMQRDLRPGRWLQRRRKKQCENQRKEREEFIIRTLPLPHKPQGQLSPPCSWVTEQLCTQISMVLVTPALHGCSIYMPPGTEAAAEAARSVLLLWSVVTPDGKAQDERSWGGLGMGQCRAGLGAWKT